jgi:two-component system sensor histidine kinase KdpD
MIGATSSLRDFDAQLSPEDKQELLDAMLSEGKRLNRYIENLLDMTRLGHGTLKLQRDCVALADIVASALRRTKELFTKVNVVRDIPHDLPLLYVHPALINVIENAAHFSSEGGEVRISARRDEAGLLVTVTDQGPGIPEGKRQRIFDMFFTGSGSDQGHYGSGLGLAICRGLIGPYGGSIEALAGPEGKGTTIDIHLPLHEPPGEMHSAAVQ